jgi:hypothetical protein
MSTELTARRIPPIVKLGYTAFLAVLVPVYWSSYGPTNFLYFCDVALFLALASVWTERPIYASMAAVGILLPQTLWVVDFLGTLVGLPVVGMTAYMFDSNLPLFTRGLSFFHFWLPFFLVYLVWRLGYDRRAFATWTGLAMLLILACYLWLPAPPAPNPNVPVNVNYVYGLSDTKPQEWMPANLWVLTLLVGLPLLVYLPTHAALRFVFAPLATDDPALKPAIANEP